MNQVRRCHGSIVEDLYSRRCSVRVTCREAVNARSRKSLHQNRKPVNQP